MADIIGMRLVEAFGWLAFALTFYPPRISVAAASPICRRKVAAPAVLR